MLPLGFTKDDIGKGGTLPSKLIRSWLLSHDRRFAKHNSLNHILFNHKICHDTNLKVSMRERGSDRRTGKLMTLVNDDDFQERLRMAVSDPTGQEARKISKLFGHSSKWLVQKLSGLLLKGVMRSPICMR